MARPRRAAGRAAGAATLLCLVAAALLVGEAAALVPADITTCTNSNGTAIPRINVAKTCSSVSIIGTGSSGLSFAPHSPTPAVCHCPPPSYPDGTAIPRINAVKTCSSVSIISTGSSGLSFARSSTKSGLLVAAAGACGDAVADGVGALCKGLDPGAAIVSAAQVCANALAALYSRQASGAAALPLFGPRLLPSTDDLLDLSDVMGKAGVTVNKQGYYQACAAGCSNAQSAAEALSQGAACGAAAAAGGCLAVSAEVRSEVFSKAIAAVAADGWTRACAQGAGAALSRTDALAAAAAASFASAIGRVAVKACASCPSCKCSKLPNLGGLNAAGRWQNAWAAFAGGRVGVAKAFASASGVACRNGTVLGTQAATDAAMAAMADMVAGAYGSLKSSAKQVGSASACSGGGISAQLEAMKEAANQVISDAGAAVYGEWCPAASAKLAQIKVLTSDLISSASSKAASVCSNSTGGLGAWLPAGAPKAAAQSRLIATALMGSKPLRQKVTDVVTTARKCGCPPSVCLFCRRAAVRKSAAPAAPMVAPAAAGTS